MDEVEASVLNRSSEDWQRVLARELAEAARKRPSTGERCDPALTIEELLGVEIRDAILDDVVP